VITIFSEKRLARRIDLKRSNWKRTRSSIAMVKKKRGTPPIQRQWCYLVLL